MGAAERVRSYYDALRSGDPLGPFFAPDDEAVKFGISERLVGHEAIAEGLRAQTETTRDWYVESQDLRVTERDCHAWFSDVVSLGWADTDKQIRYEFETRWSGTLERRASEQSDVSTGSERPSAPQPASDKPSAADPGADANGQWQFVGMHVSTASDL